MKRMAAAVLVLLVVIGGCAPGGFALPGQPPVVNSFSADPLTTSAGDSVTLSWSVSNASRVDIDQGIGSVALTGHRLVAPITTTLYTLTATGASGKTVAATTLVTVHSVTPAPIIVSFLANPPVISPGGSATLTWAIEGGDSANISPGIGPVAASGSASVSPTTSTTYTLTASSAAATVSATAQVAVSGASPSGPPVINSFIADPPTIHPGDSTTLRWDVTAATSVVLDRGIGTVSPIGTRVVSVLATTNYTLTASNSEGTVVLTIPVLVTPVPDDAEPDLTITSIAKVATSTGYVIGYTIENRGAVNSTTSMTRLYVNGVFKASDTVSALAPGQSTSRQFVGWTYDATTPVVRVVADADNHISESDEGNNEMTVSFAVETVLDLIDKASLAAWQTGAPLTDISFGGSTADPNGFAVYRANAQLEDGASYAEVLETHPKWVGGGWIQGFFPETTVPLGARLVADVGFLSGAAGSDGVIFRVWFWRSGLDIPIVLGTINASYDGDLDSFNIDLADIVGATGRIGLQVLAGSSSGQDWAIWLNARVIR